MDPAPAPPPQPHVSLAGPLPGDISDLASLLLDLQYVARLARMAATPITDDVDDDAKAAHRALWDAALIGYRRCFNQGKGHLVRRRSRRVVTEAVTHLDDDLQQAHEQFVAQAHQHVAHRVNDLQQMLVLAALTTPPAPMAIDAILWVAANHVGPTVADATLLQRLCDVLGVHLLRDLEALSAELHEECSGRLPWCYRNATPRLDDFIAESTTEDPAT